MELAATVDYLFGYDATAGVASDWMYETLARRYALDPQQVAAFGAAIPGPCTTSPPGSPKPPPVACGPSRVRRPWTPCAGSTSASRATSKRRPPALVASPG